MFDPNNMWKIVEDGGETKNFQGSDEIAVVKNVEFAKLICASPLLLAACEGVANLAGEDDLPDNGEYSGAAITDLVFSAIELTKNS